jgi:spermidine/putrescine transport system substrate-binding protein
MPKYNEIKKFFVRAMVVSLSVFFIAGIVPTTKAFAEPGSVFLWGGYDDDGLFGSYAEEYGSPAYTTFGDAEEGLQKLRAGAEFDLAWPCQGEIKRWVRAGVLEPLDTSRIDNWNDMFPEVRDLPSGMVDGKNYFAPVDWGDTTLFYMADRVTWMNDDNESFDLMEDPRVNGKVGILDSAADSLFLMMHHLGTDIREKDQLTKAAIDQAINKFREMRDNGQIRAFFGDTSSMVEALGNEEIDVALGWNEIAWNAGAKMMQPSNGTMTWACGLAIVKGADLDKAYAMINGATSQQTSEYLLSEWGYGHSNMKGFSALTADELAERGVAANPAAHLSNGMFSVMPSDEVTDYMEAQWAEMVAGG